MKQTFTHSSICFTLRRIWKFPTLLPGLFVLLLTFFTACGGDDGAEDGTYAVVEAASFTFNENDPTKNVIQVLANTEWTVYWTPETSGVSVSPATGSGNGSFYVADMPAGQTLKFGVKTASGKAVSQFVTVTRSSGSSGGDDGDERSCSASISARHPQVRTSPIPLLRGRPKPGAVPGVSVMLLTG